MMLWRVLAAVSAGLMILIFVLLKVKKITKNFYYHSFMVDDLLEESKQNDSTNRVYAPKSNTRKYVKRYVISDTKVDKCLLCNFTKKYSSISYYVVGINKKQRVCEVLKVTETNTGATSRIIGLSRKTKYVNIVVRSVDSEEINSQVIRPLSKAKIQVYSLLTSFFLFTVLFTIRHVLIELICRYSSIYFLNSIYNLSIIGAIAVVTIIYYFLCLIRYRKKNLKNRNGGALEYEYF